MPDLFQDFANEATDYELARLHEANSLQLAEIDKLKTELENLRTDYYLSQDYIEQLVQHRATLKIELESFKLAYNDIIVELSRCQLDNDHFKDDIEQLELQEKYGRD